MIAMMPSPIAPDPHAAKRRLKPPMRWHGPWRRIDACQRDSPMTGPSDTGFLVRAHRQCTPGHRLERHRLRLHSGVPGSTDHRPRSAAKGNSGDPTMDCGASSMTAQPAPPRQDPGLHDLTRSRCIKMSPTRHSHALVQAPSARSSSMIGIAQHGQRSDTLPNTGRLAA